MTFEEKIKNNIYPSKEQIIDLYLNQGLSQTEICGQFNIKSRTTFRHLLEYYDIKISKEMLFEQGQVARSADNEAMAKNFERASELVDVPDDIILGMYNKLRPNRSTKAELIAMADELEKKYNAHSCAKLVREAATIYEKRGILL